MRSDFSFSTMGGAHICTGKARNMLNQRLLKEAVTNEMVIEGLQDLDRLDMDEFTISDSFSKGFKKDIDKVMRDVGDKGFLSLPMFSEDEASAWVLLKKVNADNIVFYHRYTHERLMQDMSPYFYLNYRGDARLIIDSCERHGFDVIRADHRIICVSRSFDDYD